jgi:hypothetical protein
VTLVLDSGALIAIDRNDRAMWTRLKAAYLADVVPVTHAGVVGQVWRNGARQAQLAHALAGIDIHPVDEALGRLCGELLAASRTADVIDAALALIAEDGDDIVTSDPGDLATLVAAAGRHVELIRV